MVAAAVFFRLSAGAQAASAPAITVNGSAAHAAEVERNSRVFVPAQSVFTQLGEVVTYTAPHAVVKTKSGVELARMTLGSREATVKGTAQTLAAAPFSSNAVLMVPLRFVSEAAGATVAYSTNPRMIDIHKAMSVGGGAATLAAAPAVVAQASPAPQTPGAATVTQAAVAAPAESGGVPWWVWLLAALVILGLIFAFMRRKKEPVIITTGTGRDGGPKIVTRR